MINKGGAKSLRKEVQDVNPLGKRFEKEILKQFDDLHSQNIWGDKEIEEFLLKDKQTLNLSEFYDTETKKARYDNHGELKTHLDYVYFFNPEDGNYYKIIRITEDENSPGDVERTIVQVVKQGDT